MPLLQGLTRSFGSSYEHFALTELTLASHLLAEHYRLEPRLPCQPQRQRYSIFARHFFRSPKPACLLQMFFSQLSHAKTLEPPGEHPMIKRIVGSELVGLFFIEIGFVKLA